MSESFRQGTCSIGFYISTAGPPLIFLTGLSTGDQLVVEPTHLKNTVCICQIRSSFPKFSGWKLTKKCLSCHHHPGWPRPPFLAKKVWNSRCRHDVAQLQNAAAKCHRLTHGWRVEVKWWVGRWRLVGWRLVVEYSSRSNQTLTCEGKLRCVFFSDTSWVENWVFVHDLCDDFLFGGEGMSWFMISQKLEIKKSNHAETIWNVDVFFPRGWEPFKVSTSQRCQSMVPMELWFKVWNMQFTQLLLIKEILHRLGCIKPCKKLRINYQPQPVQDFFQKKTSFNLHRFLTFLSHVTFCHALPLARQPKPVNDRSLRLKNFEPLEGFPWLSLARSNTWTARTACTVRGVWLSLGFSKWNSISEKN